MIIFVIIDFWMPDQSLPAKWNEINLLVVVIDINLIYIQLQTFIDFFLEFDFIFGSLLTK